MKHVLTLIVLMLAGFGTIFLHTNVSDANEACFNVTGSQWGKVCNDDPSGLELTVENVCKEKMTLLYCLGQEGGARLCKIRENIPGGASFKISACKATGSYDFTGCERAYDCKQELKRMTGQ